VEKKGHVICGIKEGSIAQEMDLLPGDILLAVNDCEIEDVFDYEYMAEDEYVELWVRKADGEEPDL
jgi:NifB/MoaA-like Fe-S oxidoreductase